MTKSHSTVLLFLCARRTRRALRMLRALILLLVLCTACGPSHQQRLLQLQQLEATNDADSLLTNDSLALVLTDYFDDHGTPDERMRAHYILGRTYADLGEQPAALESFLAAAAAADTTASDCNWAKLSRVYGQMSLLFYNQNLMDDYLQSLDKAIHFAWIAKDTLTALVQTAYKVAGFMFRESMVGKKHIPVLQGNSTRQSGSTLFRL